MRRMSDMKEDFLKRTEEIKEVISNMPLNNKKNRDKYTQYIKEQLEIFSSERDTIVSEIKSRVSKIESREKKKGISFENKEKEFEDLVSKLIVMNTWNTPYEKLELDRTVYEINHYYKDNLDALNDDIRDAVNCFKKVGVNLCVKDFFYSSYVKKYMEVILDTSLDNSIIKKRLDDVYWKSPKVMNQIACNINYLYHSNEKNFVRYFDKLKTDLLSNDTYDNICKRYAELVYDKEHVGYQMDTIISELMSGKLNIKDYSYDKLVSYQSSISNGDVDIDNYEALYSSLNEYKVYKEYSFLIDKVKEIYQNKGQYKNIYKNLRKDISKLESKLLKVNKKINIQNKFFHNINKINSLDLEVDSLTDSLMEKYHDLSFCYVQELISGFSDSVSYYDILLLMCSHYVYFRKLMVENQEGISDVDILRKRKELFCFLMNGNLHILPNIKIMEDINIPRVIGDKYQLLNIKLSVDDIENNSDGIMELIRKILIIYSIKNSDIDYSELLFQYNTLSILDGE